MRRIILLALLLFCVREAQAVPTLVQVCNGAPATNASCTFPSNIGTSHLIVLLQSSCGPLTVAPVSDTLTLTYNMSSATILGFSSNCNFRNHTLNFWYACTGGSSGSDTITVTGNGGVGFTPFFIAAEFSGATCAIDGTPVANGTLGSTTGTRTGGNITTATTNALLLAGALVSGVTPGVPTVGSGFTQASTTLLGDWGGNDCGGVCTVYMVLEYKVVSPSTYATEFGFTGTFNNSGIIGWAFGPELSLAARHRSHIINSGQKVH